jgi:hypothetical protein
VIVGGVDSIPVEPLVTGKLEAGRGKRIHGRVRARCPEEREAPSSEIHSRVSKIEQIPASNKWDPRTKNQPTYNPRPPKESTYARPPINRPAC